MDTYRHANWWVLVGVLLSFILIVGPLTWADDDDDNGKKKQLVITHVVIDYEAFEMTIIGDNFDNGKTPRVHLCDTELIDIDPSPSDIFVNLTNEFMSSWHGYDCLLTVDTGRGKKRFDSYNLTIGSKGPKGDRGDKC